MRLIQAILGGILALLLLGISACSGIGFDNKRDVRVGVYENPPAVYVNSRGEAAGLFIDLIQVIAEREHWRIKPVRCDWAECLTLLEEGRIELIPDIAFTAERMDRFSFNQIAIINSWSQILTRLDESVFTIADLDGHRVAILKDSVQFEFFTQIMEGGLYSYELMPVATVEEGFAAVRDRTADAVVASGFAAARLGGKYGLQETPIVFRPVSLYFASAKGRNLDLLQRVDHYMRAWRIDPNSPYHEVLRRSMALPEQSAMPAWLKWSLLALGPIALLLLGLSVLLRWQVTQRTRELTRTTQDLELQRASLEHQVAARTAELQIAKEEAVAANQAKSEFLANMSHEIRTPMNAILGMLYLALKHDLGPHLRNQLSKAQGAAHSLLGIINDILDFSKIEAGKLEIDQVEFGFDAVLEQLTDAIGYQVENKGIEFLIRHDISIPTQLVGDPLRLGQVLLNLCGNAVKFTEQGEVELAFRCIGIEADEINIQVCVRDSGIGMSPEMQSRLFEKFSQADQSTTRRFGGTGLGLAISKNLVELMGGRIWIEESLPGKGTTLCFTVRLKIVAGAHRPVLSDQVGVLLQGVRVLVVDDNAVSREIMADLLRNFRLEVAVAVSGANALTQLENANPPFDLVLMDWRMPGMNGDEAIRRIHGNPAIAHRPKIIMVTAYGREDVLRLVEQSGADGLLIKPVSPSSLLDGILTALGRGRLLHESDAELEQAFRSVESYGLAGARVLLVEDNDINREFATELLDSQGIVVETAIHGEEAVAKVQSRQYDAVLMDVQMPVMDGLEATRRIRALPEPADRATFSGLPIIAMTALAMARDIEKTQAAGMNDHVTKPVSPEHLMTILRKWIHLPPERQTALPEGAVRETAGLPRDLLALASIDARAGIARVGGKPDAYRRQLKRFRDHHREADIEVQRLIAVDGLNKAEEYCHALKGVAGNIGANALFGTLSSIDESLKSGFTPPTDLVDDLHLRLTEVIRDIDGLAVAAESTREHAIAPLSPGEILDCVEQLIHSLDYDIGAVEPLLRHVRGGTADARLTSEIDQIAKRVDSFDIDAARTLAMELRAGLKSDTYSS